MYFSLLVQLKYDRPGKFELQVKLKWQWLRSFVTKKTEFAHACSIFKAFNLPIFTNYGNNLYKC